MPPRTEPLTLIVSRSGGFAGLRREWTCHATGEEAARLEGLADAAAWDAGAGSAGEGVGSAGEGASVRPADTPADPSGGADRFTWTITVRAGSGERTAVVPEAALDGAFAQLVDHARKSAGGGAP